jgi:hypothetical protein
VAQKAFQHIRRVLVMRCLMKRCTASLVGSGGVCAPSNKVLDVSQRKVPSSGVEGRCATVIWARCIRAVVQKDMDGFGFATLGCLMQGRSAVSICLRDGCAEADQKACHCRRAVPGGFVQWSAPCDRSLRRISAHLKKELHGFQ